MDTSIFSITVVTMFVRSQKDRHHRHGDVDFAEMILPKISESANPKVTIFIKFTHIFGCSVSRSPVRDYPVGRHMYL